MCLRPSPPRLAYVAPFDSDPEYDRVNPVIDALTPGRFRAMVAEHRPRIVRALRSMERRLDADDLAQDACVWLLRHFARGKHFARGIRFRTFLRFAYKFVLRDAREKHFCQFSGRVFLRCGDGWDADRASFDRDPPAQLPAEVVAAIATLSPKGVAAVRRFLDHGDGHRQGGQGFGFAVKSLRQRLGCEPPSQRPKYAKRRDRKGKDYATLHIGGRNVWLGRYGSPQSIERYYQLIRQHGRLPHPDAPPAPAAD